MTDKQRNTPPVPPSPQFRPRPYKGLSPRKVESRFNEVKEKIREAFREPGAAPDLSTLEEFDDEFEKVTREYEIRGDEKNRLHVEHNYYLLQCHRFFERNKAKAFECLTTALASLIHRHKRSRYRGSSLREMSKVFSVAVGKFEQTEASFDAVPVESQIETLIKSEKDSIISLPREFRIVFDRLFQTYLRERYQDVIEDWSAIGIFRSKRRRLADLEPAMQDLRLDDQYTLSLYYGLRYKLLRCFVQTITTQHFFEKDEGRREEIEALLPDLTGEMATVAQRSKGYATGFYRNLDDQYINEGKRDRILALGELDEMTAEYFHRAYAEQDALRAWKQLDDIRHFLVKKAFVDDVEFPEKLLAHFEQERDLLTAFVKLELLKGEMEDKGPALRNEWASETFSEIADNLGEAANFFKYSMADSRDSQLKPLTSTFSGGFSEFFVVELVRTYCDEAPSDGGVPEELRSLFDALRSEFDREDVDLNRDVSGRDADVDIAVENKVGIFLKNASVGPSEMGQMRRELDLAEEENFEVCVFGVNFMKNLGKLPHLHERLAVKARTHDVELVVVDIQDLSNALIAELDRAGVSCLNMAADHFYRAMDY